MSGKVTANNPLAYLGVNAVTPANFKKYSRAPSTSDVRGYTIGDWWFYSNVLYQLFSKEAGIADWAIIYPQGVAPSSFTWTTITDLTKDMEVLNGYIPNNAALITFTLPLTAEVGSEIKVMGLGAGGFKVEQNASQTITHLDKASTVGVTGYVASTNKYDVFTLRCAVADTHFRMTGVDGNITVV